MSDSNRNERNIIFKDEIDEQASNNKNLKLVQTITDENGKKSSSNPWTGEHGRVNKEILNKYQDTEFENGSILCKWATCNSNTMKSLLENELRIKKVRIKVEEFTGCQSTANSQHC